MDFIRETGNASFPPSRVGPSAQRSRAPARRSEADGPTRERPLWSPSCFRPWYNHFSSIDIPWCRISQFLMQSFPIEKRQVRLQPLVQRLDCLMRKTIHMLMLDTPPQSLDEHIVQRTPFPIHADLHPCSFQPLREG